MNSSPRPRRAPAVLAAAGILLLCAAIYLPTLDHAFVVIDDRAYLVEPERLKAGVSAENLLWALTTFHQSNWHPATWVSHLIEADLFGLTARVVHAGNALLHAGNALLLFALLRALTGSLWRSAVVAALFAAHPLRVESVAWAAERKDVLAAFFFFLCCLLYVGHARRPGWARLSAVSAAFAAGLMAKSMLVTLPFVLLLLDFWPLGRLRPTSPGAVWRPARLLAEKAPLFVLAAAASVVAFAAQQHGGSVAPLGGYPLPIRVLDSLTACGFYLTKTLWPSRLAVFYPHAAPGSPFAIAPVAFGLLAFTAITVVAVVCLRRRPHLAVGWFWFLGMLVPVIGLVQIGAQAYADRYTYLPHAGLLTALVWEAAAVLRRRCLPGPAVAAAACALVLLLAAVARRQVGHWRDDDTLFGHAVAVTADNYLAYHNHGYSFALRGRAAEAAEQYERALRIRPGSWKTAYGLGWALAAAGRTEEAAAAYEQALRIKPDLVEARRGLQLLRSLPPAAREPSPGGRR